MKAASTIGAKTVVTGSVHGDGDLEVYGRVEGDITVEGNVLIASTAEVKGAVTASAIRVAGAVEGNLQASETVAIEPDARVLGDLTTPRVSIAEGAMVRGMVRTEAEHRTARKNVPRGDDVRLGEAARSPAATRPAPVAAALPERVNRAPEPERVNRAPEPERVSRPQEPERMNRAPEPERVNRAPEPERVSRSQQEVAPPPLVSVAPPPVKKDSDARDRRPPEPRMPALAKGTKGKKKGDKRPH